MLAEHYPTLHDLRRFETDNRGLAAGTGRVPGRVTGKVSKAYTVDPNAPRRTRSQPVASMIAGAFDPSPSKQYCRLTAWTGRETDAFDGLRPLFRGIGDAFAAEVPDRFQSQMAFVRRTPEDWVVPGTPFTTITINNSYPTGVHTDKGDLDAGFSNLTTLRRGSYSGGVFVFAEYRVGVDMQDGDLLLMDAHEWHGNTAMTCNDCGQRMGPPSPIDAHEACEAERISIVCYYRTKMAECGTAEEEAQRAAAHAEHRIAMGAAAVEEMAAEAVG